MENTDRLKPIVRISKVGKVIKIAAADPVVALDLVNQHKKRYPSYLVLLNTAPFSADPLHTFVCAS